MNKEQKIFKQLREYKEYLESDGHNVIFIGLYGSQNYNLDDELSDVDARAVVLPTIKQLVTGGRVSKIYDFQKGEVDVKDVSTFMEILGKGNPAYVECTSTQYKIGDKEFIDLIQGYEINPKAVLGMMYEKRKAIEKGLPKSSPMIEKIGYDPKQLHHIIRLSRLAKGDVIYGTDSGKARMIHIKRNGKGTKEEALALANEHIEAFNWDNGFEIKPISEKVYKYIESKMVEVLFKPNKTLTARQHRTFNGNVPNNHKELFAELDGKDGTDFTYVIYSYLEFL